MFLSIAPAAARWLPVRPALCWTNANPLLCSSHYSLFSWWSLVPSRQEQQLALGQPVGGRARRPSLPLQSDLPPHPTPLHRFSPPSSGQRGPVSSPLSKRRQLLSGREENNPNLSKLLFLSCYLLLCVPASYWTERTLM